MPLATGNPVFQTVGGDASAATATYTPANATAAVTVTLANIGLSASTALASAQASAEVAAAAKSAVSGFASQIEAATADAVQTSQIGQASGVVGIDAGGGATVPPLVGGQAYLTLGAQGSTNQTHLQMATSLGLSTLTSWSDAKGSYFAVAAAALLPNSNGGTALGSSNNAWSGIVSQTAVQVVSDANDKTIIGTLGDSAFADTTTKLRAAWAAISGVVYTLKFSVNSNPRSHIGVIAQTVQSAFSAQGLDPSTWGLWCETPKTEMVEQTSTDADGKTVTTTVEQPVYEADGKTQATQQTIRYEELLTLGVFCERLERADLAARVAALESKSTTTPVA